MNTELSTTERVNPIAVVRHELTIERLREVLRYECGRFFWRISPSNRVAIGDQAGSLRTNGYWYISIDGVSHLTHRLAWFWHHGTWPELDLDHINRNKWDNRIENLREATASQNIANSRLSSSNSSGFRGVSWNKRLERWHAYICVRGTRKHLGFFETAEDAAAAYAVAAREHFGDFANIGA